MKRVIFFSILILAVCINSYAGTCRVVYKPDKTVSIILPAAKSKLANETKEQWLNRVFTKAMQGELKGFPYDDIDDALLPKSYEDRDAWEGEKGVGVYVNHEKAKTIRETKEKQRLIKEEEKRILRQQAEQNLIDKGIIKPE